MFDAFVREAIAFASNLPISQWEFLALAQHHGLPTRLLDWSDNILIAAFFACREYPSDDGVVYALRTPILKDEAVSPFEITQIIRYRPRHVTARITAQRGLFTAHPDPTLPIEELDGGETAVRKITISSGYKEKLRWNLHRFGINHSSLFPDLDGLAAHLAWFYPSIDPSDDPDISDEEPSFRKWLR